MPAPFFIRCGIDLKHYLSTGEQPRRQDWWQHLQRCFTLDEGFIFIRSQNPYMTEDFGVDRPCAAHQQYSSVRSCNNPEGESDCTLPDWEDETLTTEPTGTSFAESEILLASIGYYRYEEEGFPTVVNRDERKSRNKFRVYGAVKGVTYRLYIPIKKRESDYLDPGEFTETQLTPLELVQTAAATADYMEFDEVEFDAPAQIEGKVVQISIGVVAAPSYDLCDPLNFACDDKLTACQAACDAIAAACAAACDALDPEDFETTEAYDAAFADCNAACEEEAGFCAEDCSALNDDCLADIDRCELFLPITWVGLAINPPPE